MNIARGVYPPSGPSVSVKILNKACRGDDFFGLYPELKADQVS
jgi:hypothetical protein